MSKEITVNAMIQIVKGVNQYRPQPTSFQADWNGSAGPTPGSVLVTTGGVNISLAGLNSLGGWCRIQNLDINNYVDWGIWNGSTYFPLGELLPGEFVPIRLSRFLLTGATGTAIVNSLRLRAHTASCQCKVEAFDP